MKALQFSLAQLFPEILLVAMCLAAFRVGPPFVPDQNPLHIVFSAVAIVSGCAALGGAALRPAAGAIVGMILSCPYVPIWFLIQASAAC